jgi:hypothetical protein
MAIGVGTNLLASSTTTMKIALTDDDGNALLVTCTTTPGASQGPGYSLGCQLVDNLNGELYINTSPGSTTASNFKKITHA